MCIWFLLYLHVLKKKEEIFDLGCGFGYDFRGWVTNNWWITMTGDFERSGDGEETGFRGLGEEKGKE